MNKLEMLAKTEELVDAKSYACKKMNDAYFRFVDAYCNYVFEYLLANPLSLDLVIYDPTVANKLKDAGLICNKVANSKYLESWEVYPSGIKG